MIVGILIKVNYFINESKRGCSTDYSRGISEQYSLGADSGSATRRGSVSTVAQSIEAGSFGYYRSRRFHDGGCIGEAVFFLLIGYIRVCRKVFTWERLNLGR